MALVRNAAKKSHIHFSEVSQGDNHDEEAKGQDNAGEEADSKPSRDLPSAPYKHELSNVILSDKRQTVLLSATLTKVE